MVQPVQLAFQQQIQVLKTQHEEFVATLKQQQQQAAVAAAAAAAAAQAAAVEQLASAAAEAEKPTPMTTQAGEGTHKTA